MTNKSAVQNDEANDSGGDRRPHPFDVQVGARVRFVRKERGISQQQLAAALGKTFQQVQKYERGRNRISCSVLQDIARALNVKMAELLAESGDQADSNIEWPALGDEQSVRLLSTFSKISSNRVRRAIVNMVEAMSTELALDEDQLVDVIDRVSDR